MIMQQQRFIYLPLISIFIMSLFIGLFLATRKRSSKSMPPKKVTKHKAETPPDEALKYWTADKKQNAKGVPLPQVNNLDQEKQGTHPSPTQDA